jgi:hypothetical protein
LIAYCLLGTVVTLYYGVRSVSIQLSASGTLTHGDRRRFILVSVIQDFIYNTVCSAAGFVALALLWNAFSDVARLHQVTSGGAIVFGFLSLAAVTGISGKLPELLHLGRFPSGH